MLKIRLMGTRNDIKWFEKILKRQPKVVVTEFSELYRNKGTNRFYRMKEELIYGRHDAERMTVEELKTLIWRYFISYWNNRRICSANEGLPPMVKRQRYYESLDAVA